MTIRLNKHNIYSTPDEVVIKLPNPIYDDHDPTILDETRKNPLDTRIESPDLSDPLYDDDPRDHECDTDPGTD